MKSYVRNLYIFLGNEFSCLETDFENILPSINESILHESSGATMLYYFFQKQYLWFK